MTTAADEPLQGAASRQAWVDSGDQDEQDRRRFLATLPVIEQAKGILMAHYGIDAETAFAVLRRWSQDSNTKVVVLCTRLVDAPRRPRGRPEGLDDQLFGR